MKGNVVLLLLTLWPMCGALIGYLIGRKNKEARNYFADFVGISEFVMIVVCMIQVANGQTLSFDIMDICDQGLHLKLDGFRALYGSIAAFMWMMSTIFSREYLHHYRNRNRYYLFTLMTCGATMGVFLSKDLFTTFIFFEIMTFTSYVMVIHEETHGAMRAGEAYLAVAVIGGMVMLIGLFLLYNLIGTLDMDTLLTACKAVEDRNALYLIGGLILVGFGAKAGMFPLHIWLPKAHPVAPAPASALLSGILTKAGVFGVLVISCNIFLHDPAWGKMILSIGVITMFMGAVLAVFSINLKRTLACSSMSQIGFILVGIGMQCLLQEENTLAVWGTTLHMVNHSLIKLALFMAAGVVYMNLHDLNLNGIRGFGRNKPVLKTIFFSGYMAIIGMPLFSGYVSKTLLHESIVEYMEVLHHHGLATLPYQLTEWIFLISGGLTAAYMTKLFVCVFVEKNPYHQDKMEKSDHTYMNLQSVLALGVPAVLLFVFGVAPQTFMVPMAEFAQSFMHGEGLEHALHFFSLENLKGAVISLSIGAVVYFGFIRTCLMKQDEHGNKVYIDIWPTWLDLENAVYRPCLQGVLFLGALGCRILDHVSDWTMLLLEKTGLRKVEIPQRNEEDFQKASIINDVYVAEEDKQIAGSFSYSFLLFGLGFVTIIVYIFLVA